jgi:hypothetical protein
VLPEASPAWTWPIFFERFDFFALPHFQQKVQNPSRQFVNALSRALTLSPEAGKWTSNCSPEA